jgi:hypothetical protein
MGSGAVIYVPSFVKIGSGVQKLIGGDTHTHTHPRGQQRDPISLLYFLNKESTLKMRNLYFIVSGFHLIFLAFHNLGLRRKAINRSQD